MISEYFILVLTILQTFPFQQTDYRIIHERMSVDWYNTSHVQNLKVVMFHYKRYEKRFNFSGYLLEDLGLEITVKYTKLENTAQAYKFQSNEYREFPVQYTTNACNQWKNDAFGLGLRHINTNFTQCPLRKGFYYGSDIFLDDSKLPPYAPRGRYMLEISVYYKKNILIGTVKWYGAIEPTNPLEHVIL